MAEAVSRGRKTGSKPPAGETKAKRAGAAKAAAKTSRTTAARRGAARAASAASNGAPDDHLDPRLLEPLLDALVSARDGDFSRRLSTRRGGVVGELNGAFNDLIDQNIRMSRELQRMGRVIGREGRMTERASLGPVSGTWEESIEAII